MPDDLKITHDTDAHILLITYTNPDGHLCEFKVTHEGVIFDLWGEDNMLFSWAATFGEMEDLTH